MSRDVVLAIKGQLEANAAPAPVYSYVDPGQTGEYIWLPEDTVVTTGPAREGNEATFSVYYRAYGKAACEALARAGDFLQWESGHGHGYAEGIRYSRDSRAGPTEDPDIPGQMQIVDTITAKYYSKIKLSKGAVLQA